MKDPERSTHIAMEITMLGTGHAMVTECYNTCFIISDNDRHFMVDGGGGNTILRQLKHAGYQLTDIREIFVTHKHIDHLMGIIWIVRAICQSMVQGKHQGEVNVYAHDEVIGLIRDISDKLLLKKQSYFLDKRIHLICVNDGETKEIIGRKVTFFDIQSRKEKQFGFCMELAHGGKLTCCGDELYRPCERKYVENSTWLLHEAFCLYSQRDLFSPYEKCHTTVREACEMAEALGVENLLLYHTEDQNLERRKEMYGAEGSRYYHGNLYIPDDLERIVL